MKGNNVFGIFFLNCNYAKQMDWRKIKSLKIMLNEKLSFYFAIKVILIQLSVKVFFLFPSYQFNLVKFGNFTWYQSYEYVKSKKNRISNCQLESTVYNSSVNISISPWIKCSCEITVATAGSGLLERNFLKTAQS